MVFFCVYGCYLLSSVYMCHRSPLYTGAIAISSMYGCYRSLLCVWRTGSPYKSDIASLCIRPLSAFSSNDGPSTFSLYTGRIGFSPIDPLPVCSYRPVIAFALIETPSPSRNQRAVNLLKRSNGFYQSLPRNNAIASSDIRWLMAKQFANGCLIKVVLPQTCRCTMP